VSQRSAGGEEFNLWPIRDQSLHRVEDLDHM
jgi:hypothetical protein